MACQNCGSESLYRNEDGETMCLLCSRVQRGDMIALSEITARTGLIGKSLANRLAKMNEPVVQGKVHRRVIALLEGY
jgi:hypothetical protein